jgi:hypothetical protein
MIYRLKIRFVPVLLILIIQFRSVYSQEFGGNPPSLKWNQINNDTARIIFPAGLEKQGEDVARIIHELALTTQYTIGSKVKKINIVLQNQTTVSNGYVSLGPFRSEFFLTPTQNSFELGSLPWHKTLALHEYRHVQQNNNFRKGLTKVFYTVFGEEGQALASNLAIPDWFWEGDAVFQETLLSNQGRGRIPYFFNDYRSLWAAGKNYSWMKLRNGSYLDLTPDHYRLGYMLVAYGREKYGDTVWAEVTDRASRFKGLFYPFQHAVKRTTGESFPAFRKNAMDLFKSAQKNSENDSAAAFANRHRHFVANEEFPQWAADNIVYVKSSYKKIPAFYLRNTKSGKDKQICIKDVSDDNYFSYNNGKIVYAAYRPDSRWTWKNFNVINIVNIQTGRQRTITRRTKYFSPDISDDGKRIVTVRMDETGTNSLHFLDAYSGKIISVMPNEQQYIFTYPKFYSRSQVVSAVRNRAGEMALGIFDIASGEAKWLTEFTMNPIAFLQVTRDTVCFTMSQGSQEKLFASIRGKIYRFIEPLNNRSTGSYQLSVNNGAAAYNTYTAVGYHLFTGKAIFIASPELEPHSTDTAYPINKQRSGLNLVTDLALAHYPVSKYPSSYRLFNFHSWRPFISDPEYSYSLVSENILNTLQSELYVTYNRNEKFKKTGASLSYAGWFPVISGGASYTFGRTDVRDSQIVHWNEFNATVGLNLPLTFVHGSFTQRINLYSGFNTQQVYFTGPAKNIYDNIKFNYDEYSLSAVNQQITARQQIYPRFAQTFYARYRSIINKYTANQLLLTGSVYLPGLFTNHSLVLQAAYQQRDTMQQYSFSNSFPVSRGYPDLNFPRMWKLGVNYHFPIVYPDWGFGNIAYLLRIRGNIFYDWTETKSLRTKNLTSFRTAGAEIYFDSKWWNQLPVSFGIRYSRLLDARLAGRTPDQWELVLPVNLLSR